MTKVKTKNKKVKRVTARRGRKGEMIVKVVDMKKNFLVGDQTIEVLKGVSMEVYKGDFVIIFGPSGCGKSTLLHTILGMEPPTEGKVYVEGTDFYAKGENGIAKYRKSNIGVVFQESIWIKSLNVIDNVAFPNRLKGISEEKANAVAIENLKKFKLEDWAHYHPNELSSGQQQRVSLARALSIDPLMIVADEPTGNLDTVTGDALMDSLLELSNQGKTIMMVTHDLEYLKYANKLIHVVDGLIAEEYDGKGAAKLSLKLRSKKGKRGKTTVNDENYLETNPSTAGQVGKKNGVKKNEIEKNKSGKN